MDIDPITIRCLGCKAQRELIDFPLQAEGREGGGERAKTCNVCFSRQADRRKAAKGELISEEGQARIQVRIDQKRQQEEETAQIVTVRTWRKDNQLYRCSGCQINHRSIDFPLEEDGWSSPYCSPCFRKQYNRSPIPREVALQNRANEQRRDRELGEERVAATILQTPPGEVGSKEYRKFVKRRLLKAGIHNPDLDDISLTDEDEIQVELEEEELLGDNIDLQDGLSQEEWDEEQLLSGANTGFEGHLSPVSAPQEGRYCSGCNIRRPEEVFEGRKTCDTCRSKGKKRKKN